MTNESCPHCHRPLIEIDHYGERLIGCIECNRWGRPGGATLPMQLLEDDLEALRARSKGSPNRVTGDYYDPGGGPQCCALGVDDGSRIDAEHEAHRRAHGLRKGTNPRSLAEVGTACLGSRICEARMFNPIGVASHEQQ